MRFHVNGWASVYAAFAVLFACVTVHAAEFHAGAASIDITPTQWPVLVNGGFFSAQVDRAIDKLHARALVLSDGKTTIAMCVVDSCVLSHELVDDARRQINKATNIATDHIMISATHTHTAPSVMAVLGTDIDPHYPAFLVEKIVEAISRANANLAPARYGWAVVNAREYTNCRQWVYRPDRMLTDPFGQQSVRINMHPGFENPNTIGPSGPVDPDLSLLSLQTVDGKPIALLANFSMHYFGSQPVSADYFGRFCDQIESQVAGENTGDRPFVAIMSQGTSGDAHWMDYSRPKQKITIDQYAGTLAKLAHDAFAGIQYHADATLAIRERDLRLRVREPDEQRLAWARKVVAEMGDRLPKSQPQVYAREAILLHEHPTRDVKIQAIRIGELGIATISNEVFALSGLKIKSTSPLAHTFNIELANGEDGYVPPAELHPMGGYTTWPARSACLEIGAEAAIVNAVGGLLSEVAEKPLKQIVDSKGAYAEQVISAKPLAYYRMNEMGGSIIADASGNHADATASTGVLFYLDGPRAIAFSGGNVLNRALHFAGGRVSTVLKDLGNSYSVELWFWNGLPGETRPVAGYLFSRGLPDDPNATGDHLGIGGSSLAQNHLFFFNGNVTNRVIEGVSKIEPKTWNHVVLVRDGRKVAVYLNGNPEPEIVGEANVTVAPEIGNIFLGGRNDNRFNLEGKLDEVAIYNHALTADQAIARYKLTGLAVGKRPVELIAPKSPEEELATFKVPDGYEVQLVAAEPLVRDPVAIAWGADGRLWVAEMSDYPLGVDDKGKPGGRIRYLEDTDNDGKFDKSVAILEEVRFPTSVMPWRDGVLVTAAPEIFFAADRDGDGKAEIREPLYVGFTEGNTQLRVNGLRYGLDNWVYCANGWSSRDPIRSVKTLEQIEISGRDLRIKPDDGLLQADTGMTESGRNRDDWGNWFGCNNSYPVWHFVLSDRYTKRNPHVAPPEQTFVMTGGNPKVFPISREQKRYHSFEHAGHYTSACATTVYRDDWMFPRDGTTHHFICEPMHNLVQHLVSHENGATFTMAEHSRGEEKMDFLASTDEWFRPVNLMTGPDGAMYVADMYRYMIEHPDWLPPEGAREWKPFYRAGNDKGRIWRIVPKGQKPRAIPRMDKLNGPELAAALDSPNGWQRDTAQQLLIWRKDTSAAARLEELVTSSKNPLARLHALCTLDGLGLSKADLVAKAMSDENSAIRRQAIRIAEPMAKSSPSLIEAATRLITDPDTKVRMQLACSLGEWSDPRAGQALAQLAVKDADNVYISAAVMGSAVPHYAAIVDTLLSTHGSIRGPLYRNLLNMALALGNRDILARLLEPVVTPKDGKTYTGDQLIAWSNWLNLLAAQKKDADSIGKGGDALAQRMKSSAALTDTAREVAIDDVRTIEERAAAANLLARDEMDVEVDLDLLKALLTPQTPPAVQLAVVKSIARSAGDKTPSILTDTWGSLSPEIRVASVDLLLGQEPWAYALLQQVQSGRVSPADLDVSRRHRLDKLNSPRIKELATKVLGEASNAARTKVVETYEPSLKLTGDIKRGMKTYLQNCAVCHKYGEQGNEIGPDLRSVRDWPAETILANVLDPNRKVEPKYLSFTATMNNGDVAFGIITSEAGSSLTIKGLDGKETTVLRANMKSLECSNRSLMPEGLESTINRQQIADVIRFLKEPPEPTAH